MVETLSEYGCTFFPLPFLWFCNQRLPNIVWLLSWCFWVTVFNLRPNSLPYLEVFPSTQPHQGRLALVCMSRISSFSRRSFWILLSMASRELWVMTQEDRKWGHAPFLALVLDLHMATDCFWLGTACHWLLGCPSPITAQHRLTTCTLGILGTSQAYIHQ